MELKISKLLMRMGFEPSLKGFAFIVKSVAVILENNCNQMKVNEIYNEVCAKLEEELKYCTYDRNIRHAIERAYISDCKLYREVFNGKRPKVKDALYRIALVMKEEM